MSVFPFINTETVQAPVSTLPVFREYAYDFKNKTLLLKNGKTYLVEGNEALRIWIYFTLVTARYRYTAYDSAYGSEIENQLIGLSMEDEIIQMEMERYITETLMPNPYIEELLEFDFILLPDGIDVGFTCRSIYGAQRIQHEIKGVI